jgi:transposase-like protein
MEDLNLAKLPKYLSDETKAWALLERLRWPDGEPVCPHCGTKDAAHYLLKARNGTRETRMGNVSYRRIWKCRNKACRRQFSVLVGSIFESSKIPVSKWLLAIWLTGAGKNGVSALELQRHLGIAYQSAWFMSHRLRESMKREPVASMFSGVVVADETFVGGAPRNRHGYKPGRGGQGVTDKTPVLALISKDTGMARTRVVTDVTGATLRKAMAHYVDMPNTVLHTDGAKSYESISAEFAAHESVDHFSGEYVRGDVTTNDAESFFSQFKRSLNGTFHNVSKEHLGRYVDEFEFRWNTRKVSDAKRVQTLIDGAAGRRLTYRPLTGR